MKAKIEGLEPDQLNPHNFGGMCSRSAVVQRAAGKREDGGIATVATTEAPAIVVDWERWELIREVLPMRYVELPKNNKAILLDAHSRMSVENILGSARNWKTNETELLCDIFISATEEDVIQKIEEGHLDSVSIGYQTDPFRTIEIPKGAAVTIDGVEYKNEFNDDMPLLVRTFWKIKELSLVPIGADEAAKLKRSEQNGIKTEDPDLQQKLNEATNQIKNLEDKVNSITIQKEAKVAEPTEKTIEQIRIEACNEISDIGEKQWRGSFKELASKTNREILAGKFSHTTKEALVLEFHKSITDEIQKDGGKQFPSVSLKDFSKKEALEYSPSRAIGIILRGEKRESLEFEVSQDIMKACGQSPSEKGFFLAANFQARAISELYGIGQRAHSAGVFGEGGAFVVDDFRPEMLKEVVRNETVLGVAGATIISGLSGNLVVPKIVTGLTSYTPAENIAVDKSYIVVDLEEVAPKRISTATEMGREQFIRTNKGLPGLDQILIKELFGSQNVKLDYEGINGTGADNRPTGILNMTGMSAPSLSVVNLQRIINFKRKVANLNGLKQNMKWLNSIDVETLLETTRRFQDGNGDRTLYQDGKIESYTALSSKQIPDAYSIFGNWAEYYILLWGIQELIVADQPKHLNWQVEFSLHQLANFYLRSTEQFAIADDAPVAAWDDLDV